MCCINLRNFLGVPLKVSSAQKFRALKKKKFNFFGKNKNKQHFLWVSAMFTNNYRNAVTLVAPLFGKYKKGDDDLILATRYCRWDRCVLAGATKPKFFPHWTILVRYHFMWRFFFATGSSSTRSTRRWPSSRTGVRSAASVSGCSPARASPRSFSAPSPQTSKSRDTELTSWTTWRSANLSFFLFSPPHSLPIRKETQLFCAVHLKQKSRMASLV